MTKRLISFLLTLVFLVALPLSARYRYNPYTRKLDFYEAAGDIVLGDIGDITLTGLATGNVLYYDGAAWVNLATGANGELLTLAAGIPSWAGAPAPGAHAASHEVGGADLVDHDQLTNYLAAQHLTLPNTIVAVLTNHNAAVHVALGFLALPSTIAAVLTDHNLLAHTALGLFDQSSDVDHDATTNYLAAQHLTLPATIATVLTDHNKAAHDALLIDADTVDGEHAAAIVTNARVKAHFPDTIANILSDHNLLAHTALGLFDASADVDHNATTNYAANQHVVLPNTIANVLTDHNLAAHTALGLFDASGDVDHNLTTNYVANQHINWTAAASNFSTSEDFTLVWADAADVGSITQTAVAGPGATPLIDIDDDRTGATANSLAEATLFIEAEGYAALFVDKGLSGFRAVDVYGDFTAEEDVFWTWADAADLATITQAAVAGPGGSPLINVDDDRTGVTANTTGEATIVIDADGAYAFYVADGWIDFGTATQLFNRGDWNTFEDVFWNWSDTGDHADITQTSVAGTATVPLINIDDDRTGVTADTVGEATIYMDADGSYAFYIADGYFGLADNAYLSGNVYFSGADFVFNAGRSIHNDDIYLQLGTQQDIEHQYRSNSTEDAYYLIRTRKLAADDSTAIFLTRDLTPWAVTTWNDWLSPTWIQTNDEGADANDYAGVIMGERAQASVLVAHYFDFYAMTGAADAAVDPSNAEVAAIFRFGPNGTGVPDNATTPGDVLIEGNLEVDGMIYQDGGSSDIKVIILKVVAFDVAIPAIADGVAYVTIPIEMNGFDLVSVGAHVYTASDTGPVSIQIHNLTQTDDMLTTNLTIDQDELDSITAAVPAVIDGTKDDVATANAIRIDIDGAGANGAGLEIRMGYKDPT